VSACPAGCGFTTVLGTLATGALCQDVDRGDPARVVHDIPFCSPDLVEQQRPSTQSGVGQTIVSRAPDKILAVSVTSECLVTSAVLPAVGRRPRLDRRPRWVPFDDVAVQIQLVGFVLTGERNPLVDPLTVRGPGAYSLIYSGAHGEYQDLHAGVIYVGMSVGDIGERVSSHRASIERNPDLRVDDMAVVAVPCAGGHFAKLAEDLLIGAFDPPWCRPGMKGFGSRPQGARRPQRRSRYDAMFPGRADRSQA
jgi:hypothetical protein